MCVIDLYFNAHFALYVTMDFSMDQSLLGKQNLDYFAKIKFM